MTPRQKQVLTSIRTLTVDGVAPSFEEIREHCGVSSKSEIHRIVSVLENAGYLVRLPNQSRSLTLTTPEHLDAMTPDALRALRAEIYRRLAA